MEQENKPTACGCEKCKCGKGLKVAVVATTVLALVGAGFGVYGMMRKPVAEPAVEIKNESASFYDGVLASIKNLAELEKEYPKYSDGLTYNFKSTGYNGKYVYAEIDSEANLLFSTYATEPKKMASDVVFLDFLYEGVAGESLYFVRSNGTVGVIKNVTEADYTLVEPVVEEISTDAKIVSAKNIKTSTGHKVVLVDTEGKFIDL